MDARGLEARDGVGPLPPAVHDVEVVRARADAFDTRLKNIALVPRHLDGPRLAADDAYTQALRERRPDAELRAPVRQRARAEVKLPLRSSRWL